MKKKLITATVVLFLIGILVGFALYSRILSEAEVEAGEPVRAEYFARFAFDKANIHFTDASMEGMTAESVGTISIEIAAWPIVRTVQLKVVDTIAPSADGRTVTGRPGQEFLPEDFVENISDATAVTVRFQQVPDNRTLGEQEVTVLVTDSGGNTTKVASMLQIVNIKDTVTIEAGSTVPEAEAFLMQEGEAEYVSLPEDIDTSHVGTYEVEILSDGIVSGATLLVNDTVKPEVTVKRLSGWVGKEINPMQFAETIQDATDVTASFAAPVDFSKEGEGSAVAVFTDEGGNTVEKQVYFTLKKDTVAPEVSVSEIDVVLGGNISYKKAVNYSDNADSREELTLEIDKSAVDINTLGTYNVTYTVTDTSGNSTKAQGVVRVLDKQPDYYDEDLVNQKADEILAQILTDDMTQREQAKAIYTWLRQNIGYINHSEKGEWVRAAYEGLYKHQGDCYVYACTAKVLLTRAGIPNIDIVKLTVNPSHYWNLVDVGDGWYHFDATPRKDKSVFFLVTDEELREYSQAHKNSHAYDESLYPEIN